MMPMLHSPDDMTRENWSDEIRFQPCNVRLTRTMSSTGIPPDADDQRVSASIASQIESAAPGGT